MEKTMNKRGTSGHSVTVGLPKKEFELIDKEGNVAARSVCGLTLAIIAGQMWPDQQQDVERSGAGWDIQTVGAK